VTRLKILPRNGAGRKLPTFSGPSFARKGAIACGPSRLGPWAVRTRLNEPPSCRTRRSEIWAGCAVTVPYNPLGAIDTNITEGSIS
jgi:hypothetical protein